MVQRSYIECSTCGKLYQLKIQLDQNIDIYDWPISFECKECGDIIKYTLGKKGLIPKECDYIPSPEDEPVTTIGYSSSLPITDELYMRNLNYRESMVRFSPFFNLQHGHFTIEEIHEFDGFLKRLQQNFLPYRNVLATLLPILKKGKPTPFSKKMASFFNMKDFMPIKNAQVMFDAYFELLEKSHANLSTPHYTDNYYKRYIEPLNQWIDKASKDEVKDAKTRLDDSGKISLWYKDKALPYIAELVGNSHKLIPVMIYASVGESEVTKRGDLKIVSIALKEALTWYKDGYEVFAKGLKVLVGINNIVENGNIDIFMNPKLGDVDTISKFAGKTSGKMVEHLENYATITEYLDGSMNNKIRNAASHDGIKYDAETQQVHCYYDATDGSKVYDTNLMGICMLCYVQLLHIMEVTMLTRKLVEKAK